MVPTKEDLMFFASKHMGTSVDRIRMEYVVKEIDMGAHPVGSTLDLGLIYIDKLNGMFSESMNSFQDFSFDGARVLNWYDLIDWLGGVSFNIFRCGFFVDSVTLGNSMPIRFFISGYEFSRI